MYKKFDVRSSDTKQIMGLIVFGQQVEARSNIGCGLKNI